MLLPIATYCDLLRPIATYCDLFATFYYHQLQPQKFKRSTLIIVFNIFKINFLDVVNFYYLLRPITTSLRPITTYYDHFTTFYDRACVWYLYRLLDSPGNELKALY